MDQNNKKMQSSPTVEIFDISEDEQAEDLGTNDLHRSTIALNMRFNDKIGEGPEAPKRNSFLNALMQETTAYGQILSP